MYFAACEYLGGFSFWSLVTLRTFGLHSRNAMTLEDGCRAMPEKKRRKKLRCDECKMTIPSLLSL